MSNKHKKVCRVLSYIERLLILISTVIGLVSISAFSSLVGIPIGITSSVVGLTLFVVTAEFKKYISQ